MILPDTKLNFFRQSGWMMVANIGCGVLMMLVYQFASRLTPVSDLAVFQTMLRIFVLVTIPASALQTILAQQSAAAISPAAQRQLSGDARGLLKSTFAFWILLFVLAIIFRRQFASVFQTGDSNVIWATMFLILAALWMPVFQGLLQGMQKFFPLGCSMILNGAGRLTAVAVGVLLFQVGATGAIVGACIGVFLAAALAAWPAREAFRPEPAPFAWRSFLKKIGPLTAAAGSTLFIINVDMPLVQAFFDKDQTQYYGAAEAIGISVVTLCTPLAAVMFPKIVRSRATATASNALYLAIGATIALGGAGALFCTLFPELPLRIMFFRNPDMVKASVLIPWFMWAMVPITLYNVLVNNLIARERYAIIPWTAIIPLAYALTVYLFLRQTTLPPFDAFQRVIQILLGFSSLLCAVAVWCTARADSSSTHSPSTAATPSSAPPPQSSPTSSTAPGTGP